MSLAVVPVPAPGFERTQWTMPQTGQLDLRVQFANGYIDTGRTYKAQDLRWDKTGSGWDVGAIAAA